MIKFNPDLVRFEYCLIKSVTTALGGSVRLYDAEESKRLGKSVTARYEVPFAVARQFKEAHKHTDYLVPVLGCLVWYGDQIVMIDRGPHHLNHENLFGENKWTSSLETTYNKHGRAVCAMKPDTWFTDGTYVYQVPDDLEMAINMGENLTNDRMMRGVTVSAWKFADLNHPSLISNPGTRTLVAIVTGDTVILTPPIWKNVLDIRKNDQNEEGVVDGRFDMLDKHFQVNLDFAISAGRAVGDVFGFDHIGPLQLDELMIALCTVNLPSVQKSKRSTTPIGLTFIHAFAWVAGLIAKCGNMSDYTKMRAVLKMLATKGIFKRDLLENSMKSGVKPQLMDKNTALQVAGDKLKDMSMADYWSNKIKPQSDSTASTGLMVDED